MGTWVAVAVGLFVLGSIMALKPSAIDVRLDKLRMTARRLQLNPKVVACPDWIRGRNNEFGKGMLGQYALVIDGLKLPETRYIVIDNELRADNTFFKVNTLASGNTDTEQTNRATSDIYPQQQIEQEKHNLGDNFILDKEALILPDTIAPFVKGVYTKANSIVVFWEDSSYVKPNTNPTFNSEAIEPDLLTLKAKMSAWAQKVSEESLS